MPLETIFSLCSLAAVIGWLALLIAPISPTRLIRVARAMALLLCAAYFTQLFTITQPVQGGSFSTLAGVVALFSLPGNVMLGWTHFLAFDLFIGSSPSCSGPSACSPTSPSVQFTSGVATVG
jgi:Domain of unknown function (DUF4281)